MLIKNFSLSSKSLLTAFIMIQKIMKLITILTKVIYYISCIININENSKKFEGFELFT